MSSDRGRTRGVVLTEDRRSERFFRELLRDLGFDVRKFRFETAPSGKGAGESWVLERYPHEVRVLRSKNFQRDLCLLCVRDGDNIGVSGRKSELDEKLRTTHLDPRLSDERISTPVPTWAIENWLLELLGYQDVDESRGPSERTWKQIYEQRYGDVPLKNAARAWREHSPRLSSLTDGKVELSRLDF